MTFVGAVVASIACMAPGRSSAIDSARSRRVARRNRFEISPRPIKHSQVASTGSETAGPTSPTVRPSNRATCQVLAGLRPGTNFSAPNHRNTIPERPILRTGTPYRARWPAIAASRPSSPPGTCGCLYRRSNSSGRDATGIGGRTWSNSRECRASCRTGSPTVHADIAGASAGQVMLSHRKRHQP